ncbi:hypothetical protein HYS31_00870 [Candidatus Woesearchaeota archaeon]|nr:hypothetical protein [Candidatus Woesearchaeota archaeon]
MKLVCFVILAFLVSSCSQPIEIKNEDSGVLDIKEAVIRTSDAETYEDWQEKPKEPKISIIAPKDMEMLNSSDIWVVLDISNFKLVPQESYPKNWQGITRVWFDGIWQMGAKSYYVFENESNGERTITAELMLSNYTVLPYSDTIRIVINKTK